MYDMQQGTQMGQGMQGQGGVESMSSYTAPAEEQPAPDLLAAKEQKKGSNPTTNIIKVLAIVILLALLVLVNVLHVHV